ncbi:glycosyltransferase [Streptomyces sp. NPDC126514]|uniref:glycosyltransferase n=1 Tax=Streptomyces sp. NPDC126514 TaxID=3155210 RepID=UPI00331E50E1
MSVKRILIVRRDRCESVRFSVISGPSGHHGASMKILALAVGTRGDVAPFTGLGAQFRGSGHQFAIATQPRFADLVTAAGSEYRPLPAEFLPFPGRGPSWQLELFRHVAAFIHEMGRSMVPLVEVDADVLLLPAITAPLGWQLAEATGALAVGAYLQPGHPTAEFAPSLGSGRSLGCWGNRAAVQLTSGFHNRMYAAAAKELRAGLGLPRASVGAVRRHREKAGWPVLYGYSPAVVPRPADWRDGLEVVGNWWPSETVSQTRLPEELEDFLQAGPPPVFVGFGSMGVGEGEGLSEIAVAALRLAGVRGVVQAGWAELTAVGGGGDILTVGELPHRLIFPRAAAVVHHAGAGTTAAALRAGVPAVTVPMMADQPFWARRLAALGVSPAPIPFGRLTAERLARAITEALGHPGYRERASALAGRMSAEDGAGIAVTLLERWVRKSDAS